MSVVIPHKFIDSISKAKDPKQSILDFIGGLDDIEVIGDYVMVAVYMRPEKTAGGIIRPDQNKIEDVYQGKVGLVLKCGPDAFIDKETGERYEQALNPGDWAAFWVGDGKSFEVVGDGVSLGGGNTPCRLVKDINFRLRLKNPNRIL